VGQVAVVTGAARNLGSVIALTLAAQGFDLVVNTRRNLEEAQRVADRATSLGVTARAVAADVTDEAAVQDMFGQASAVGDVRVLVNNAALRSRVPLDDLSLAEWRTATAVILDGAFLCSRSAIPLMRGAGGGRVVNVLGGNAMAGDPARPHVAAAKHGLVGLTLALARACEADPITVNAVSPVGLHGDDAQLRVGRQHVADVVGLLVSDSAAAVTGQVIQVHGARRTARREDGIR
jgi:3-oxoacyl-[acyl-carrier protein] reductase